MEDKIWSKKRNLRISRMNIFRSSFREGEESLSSIEVPALEFIWASWKVSMVEKKKAMGRSIDIFVLLFLFRLYSSPYISFRMENLFFSIWWITQRRNFDFYFSFPFRSKTKVFRSRNWLGTSFLYATCSSRIWDEIWIFIRTVSVEIELVDEACF